MNFTASLNENMARTIEPWPTRKRKVSVAAILFGKVYEIVPLQLSSSKSCSPSTSDPLASFLKMAHLMPKCRLTHLYSGFDPLSGLNCFAERIGANVRARQTAVILRGCDFFVFAQKSMLKTNGLRTKKSGKFKKVTNSERAQRVEGSAVVLEPGAPPSASLCFCA